MGYIDKFISILADEGEKLIKEAFATANFDKRKTQNLHDSYGSAVFYGGRKVNGTERYFDALATTGKFDPYSDSIVKGREEIKKFFDEYKPASKNIELVVAVAMFYAEILEKQKGGIKRKYTVISGISGEMEALRKKYNGMVRRINI